MINKGNIPIYFVKQNKMGVDPIKFSCSAEGYPYCPFNLRYHKNEYLRYHKTTSIYIF
jgi:hypothetical protein